MMAVGSCGGPPYPAPVDSTVTVNPATLTFGTPELVVMYEAVAQDIDGNVLPYVAVTADIGNAHDTGRSAFYMLLPETAIVYDTDDSTSWASQADDYLQIIEINDEIAPSRLETMTDENGVARFFAYLQCIPTKCGLSDGDILDSCDDLSQPKWAGLAGKNCAGSAGSLQISIGTAGAVATIDGSGFSIQL